jgi:hypothetical protein
MPACKPFPSRRDRGFVSRAHSQRGNLIAKNHNPGISPRASAPGRKNQRAGPMRPAARSHERARAANPQTRGAPRSRWRARSARNQELAQFAGFGRGVASPGMIPMAQGTISSHIR